MGSLPRPRTSHMTDDEICQQYRDGASQGLLSLRARISCSKIREILVANNVRVRQSSEAIRLELRTRPRRHSHRPVFKGHV